MNRFLSGTGVVSIMLPMIVLLTSFTREIYISQKSLKISANTDALTQIYNRKALYEFGLHEFESTPLQTKNFTLLLFDIDHFKNVNDLYGHPAGDVLLKDLAGLINSHIRSSDTLARYGGEEFAILLRDTDKEAGQVIAQKILSLVESNTFTIDDVDIQITISIGVAQYTDHLTGFDHMMQIVDKALYEAKNKGRNQVVSVH